MLFDARDVMLNENQDFDVQNISGKVEPFDSEYADLRYWSKNLNLYRSTITMEGQGKAV